MTRWRDLQLRPLPGGEPAWIRWGRRLTLLGGLGILAVAIVLTVQFMQTPAIELQGPPVSQYAAVHRVPCTPPPGPRAGLWIEIPALHVALPVRDAEAAAPIPDWVALHYPGTAPPGAPGNSYLYAHGLCGMFGPLLWAQPGDLVMLRNYSTGSVETFRVSRVVGRVRWDDTSWLRRRSAAPMLTLQTCVGADPDTDRWIVVATL